MLNFSIYIPTFNRREKLLATLQSIFCQDEAGDVQIVLLDNHSDYDVEEVVKNAYPQRNIKIIKYLCNIGGALNINMPFFFCETKWLWILSDDDVVKNHSLKTIFKDIEEHPDAGVLKYSFDGYISAHNEDEEYFSLEDLAGETGKKKPTGLMLCSNAVYNLEILEPFRGEIIKYAYNNIGAYLPICYMLDAGAGRLLVRKESIIRYMESDISTSWNSFQLYLASGTFFDYPFKSSGKVLKKLWDAGPVPPKDFIKQIEKRSLYKDKFKCQIAFDKVYPYYLSGFCKRKVFKIAFYFYKLTGYNIFKLL